MDSKPDEKSLRGGVIVIGSLFWETESNCISGSEEKGKERRIWREENLNVDARTAIKLPVRYGRSSSSRSCTYTMVLSSEFCNGNGYGLIVPYLESLDFDDAATFKQQVLKLAKVEGIKKDKGWGAIAIWINPKSKKEIAEKWAKVKSDYYGHAGLITRFDWEDGKLINENYELTGIEIETELDFLLCTYIQPSHKNKDKNLQKKYPSPMEIANEIISSGYDTYFRQNVANGIITDDDAAIEGFLLQGGQS